MGGDQQESQVACQRQQSKRNGLSVLSCDCPTPWPLFKVVLYLIYYVNLNPRSSVRVENNRK